MERLQKQLCAAMKEHLVSGARPFIPEAGRLFWGLFVALSRCRTYHASGPNPISHVEIEAFCQLHRWPLEPRHIDIITALDATWMEHALPREGAPPRRSSGQAMSPEAFDAVFA